MNKKVIKYVLIVSGIVLLFGLGIWGYKYIKNRNDDKKVNENENELKEVESLTSVGSVTINTYSVDIYKNYFIRNEHEYSFINQNESRQTVDLYDTVWYITMYVNNIKLKSSWIAYTCESVRNTYSAENDPSNSKITNRITGNYLGNYIALSVSAYYEREYLSFFNRYGSTIGKIGTDIESYPFTKVFDVTTGDMIYAIPTNSNEKISFTTNVTDGSTTISGKAFSRNMYVNANLNAVYYLKSNYSLSDGNNTEIHKVVFGDSYTNKFQDTIIGYTSATITLNS